MCQFVNVGSLLVVYAAAQRSRLTYMHVHHLSIPSIPTDSRCNDHQCVFIHEISYTSLVLRAVAGLCDDVEFEGV